MTTLLAIDSATQTGSVALCHQGEVVSREALMPREHSVRMLPMIDACINEMGIALPMIEAIAVTHGPGSFMGVRFGIGLAQGLGFGLDCPIIPLSTLRVLAQTATTISSATHFLAGWDARMGGIYWGEYTKQDDDCVQACQPDQVTDIAQFQWPKQTTTLVGNAWQLGGLQSSLPSHCHADTQGLSLYPKASAMLILAEQALACGRNVSARDIQALYLREGVAR